MDMMEYVASVYQRLQGYRGVSAYHQMWMGDYHGVSFYHQGMIICW